MRGRGDGTTGHGGGGGGWGGSAGEAHPQLDDEADRRVSGGRGWMVNGAARQHVVGAAVGGAGGGGHFLYVYVNEFCLGLWDAIFNLSNC